MKVRNPNRYNAYKNNNRGLYCDCVFRYSERVAEAAEIKLDMGWKVFAAVEGSLNGADKVGVTKAMREQAINVIIKYWQYGIDLQEEMDKKGIFRFKSNR